MNFMRSLRGSVRAVSCGTSRPARDDDHDPAPPALTRRTPALTRRAPAPAPGSRRPAAAPRVARQDVGARPGPLGLVQLVSVVRVHDGRPFVGEVSPCHPDDERLPPPWTPPRRISRAPAERGSDPPVAVPD